MRRVFLFAYVSAMMLAIPLLVAEERRAAASNNASDTESTEVSASCRSVVNDYRAQLKARPNLSREQFLALLVETTKRSPSCAPALARAATIARIDWAMEILRASFGAVGADCEMRVQILRRVIAADPARASQLIDLAIKLAPTCADAFVEIGKGERNGPGLGPDPSQGVWGNPPGSNGTGGQGGVVTVCHNGQTILLPADQVKRFLQQNPGATLGACQVTPVNNS